MLAVNAQQMRLLDPPALNLHTDDGTGQPGHGNDVRHCQGGPGEDTNRGGAQQ